MSARIPIVPDAPSPAPTPDARPPRRPHERLAERFLPAVTAASIVVIAAAVAWVVWPEDGGDAPATETDGGSTDVAQAGDTADSGDVIDAAEVTPTASDDSVTADDAEPEAGPPTNGYGLRLLPPDGVRRSGVAVTGGPDAVEPEPPGGGWPEHVVVLVHGLDDPGWIWRELAPALAAAGRRVAEMHYPNDGPIADSADLFAAELARARDLGVERIDVVAHSMGGLVTRDVLTRDAYYAGDGSGGERFPTVDRFIMCGTPNHGSAMARLQGISELRDQVARFARGDGVWGGHRLDGAGEAGRDLLPGSAFLEDLNDRPLARDVRHTIIAGRVSPVGGDEAGRVGRRVQDFVDRAGAPSWLRDAFGDFDERAEMAVGRVARGLGDGLVTIDSARLDGVDDFHVVDANHATMVWNVLPGSDTVPPALPIVLERLAPAAVAGDGGDPTGEDGERD